MHRGLLNGGSYTSLDQVYRGTTLPNKKADVKKMLRLGAVAKKKLDPLFDQSVSEMTAVLTEEEYFEEDEKRELEKMPTVSAEETALLG